MSASWALAVVMGSLAAWGLVTAWLAGRLGRGRFGWWVVGTALGPLSLPALLGLVHADRRRPPGPLPLTGPDRPGAPRVLVAAASPAGLLATARAARRHLGVGDTVVTLALVVDADLTPAGPIIPPRLRHELEERLPAVFHAAEAALDDAPTERLVLFGAPAWAVAAELGRVDYRCAVLSAEHWPGGRRALTKLALGATTPILAAGRPAHPAPARPSAAPGITRPLVHTPGSHP